MKLSDFVLLCGARGLQPYVAMVDDYCHTHGISRAEFFDNFSLFVARAYASAGLDFLACDAAMNNLMAFAQHDVPPFTWAVFEAFDQGEYRHRDDPSDVDPEAKYTRPLIQAVLARETDESGRQ